MRNNLIIICFNAQGNLVICADNIQFYSVNVLPFKSSSQRSLLLHLYSADSANFRELLSGSTIRHCCKKKTVHWSQQSCRNHRHNKYLDASLAARPHVNGAAILVRATLHNSHIRTEENIPDSSAAWASTNRRTIIKTDLRVLSFR